MSSIRFATTKLLSWGGYVLIGLVATLLVSVALVVVAQAQSSPSDTYEWVDDNTILAKPSGIRYIFKEYQPARPLGSGDTGGPAVPAHYAPDLPLGQRVDQGKGLADKLIDMSGDRKTATAQVLVKCSTSGHVTQKTVCETIDAKVSLDIATISTCPDGTEKQGTACVNIAEQERRIYEQVVKKYLSGIAEVAYGGWAAKNCGRVSDCSKEGFMRGDFSSVVRQCLISASSRASDNLSGGSPEGKDPKKLFADCLTSKYTDLKGAESRILGVIEKASIADIVKQVIDGTTTTATPPALRCDSPKVPSEDGKSCVDAPEEKTSCAVPGVGWIVCPVTNFLAGIADGTYNFLANNFLEIETEITGGGTKGAWEVMRGFANAAFIIVFLIIIYSQITGAGITNYGIKKLLPKLFISAILVNISFFICQIAVDLSNILGYSIKGLFESVGAQIPIPEGVAYGDVQTGEGSLGFVGATAAVLATGAGIYVALPFLGGAILAAVIAGLSIGFLLIARKALVILLIVLAPLAFVAFLLPNTEGIFKKWYKMFTSMLMVFPVVGMLFGAGQLASQVLKPASKDDIILSIVASVAAILPLFLVWGVMKKSMEAAGSLAGTINNLGGKLNKSAQSRYEESKLGQAGKYAQDRRKQSRTLAQAGSYDGKNVFRRASSSLNKRFNESRISGQFGDRSAAMGVSMVAEEDQKSVDRAAVLMKSRTDPANELSYASKQLEEANKSGDKIKARAAAKVLMSGGGQGKKILRETLGSLEANSPNGKVNKDIENELRSDINAAGLKGSDNVLATWGYKDSSIQAIQANGDTYNKLSSVELAGQDPDFLNSQHITPQQAHAVLTSDAASGMLTNEKRQILERKRGNYGQQTPGGGTPPNVSGGVGSNWNQGPGGNTPPNPPGGGSTP